MVEFSKLAACYPLLWREGVFGPEPVAVGGLFPQSALWSAGKDESGDMPLLLMAYPFAAPHYDGAQGSTMVLIDEAKAMTDQAGEPAFDAVGAFGRLAQDAIEALYVYLANRTRTLEISRALQGAQLLEPWQARIVFDDQAVAIDGLFTVKRDWTVSAETGKILATFGAAAALMIEMHHISLQNLQTLADRQSTRQLGGAQS